MARATARMCQPYLEVTKMNDGIWTVRFWKATLERMIKSVAQGMITLWFLDGVTNILSLPLGEHAGIILGYAVLSLLTSIVSSRIGQSDSPSLVGEDDRPSGRHHTT